ncbi:MAG: hypothetical protein HKN12_03910 [Gemmatimonadetes bacterium]|nr:hypothetical protein [Gemmatimonadota bacterium]
MRVGPSISIFGTVFVAALAGPGLPSPADATTWVVPDSVATVSVALGLAAAGDTVLVQPGTYPEAIVLVDGVTVRSASPHGAVLDGSGAGCVVTATACGPGTVVEGFIIRNGTTAGLGGGLCATLSTLTVRNCRFENNEAQHGGGIGGDASGFSIEDCEFHDNTATQTGGGISVTGTSSPVIQGCTFESNSGVAGGAIAVRNGATPAVSLCLLDDNDADQGGAIWYDLFTGGTVTGCTLVNNDAASLGGGFFFNTLATPVVSDCIVSFSVSGEGAYAVAGSVPVFGCCLVFGNAGGDALAGVTDLGTNLFTDPQFCDPGQQIYTLQDSSPALPGGSCGLIGAFGAGGCGATGAGAGVVTTSWGRVKALYSAGYSANP